MIWNKFKRILGIKDGASADSNSDKGTSAVEGPASKIKWYDANSNPWQVPIVDVRPITLSMISTTADPQLAANAVSYAHEDGSAFVDQQPVFERTVPANLAYPVEGALADGVLFLPQQMEHKWAIFYREGRIIFVRSWQRQVFVVAKTEHRNGLLVVTQVQGTFGGAEEGVDFTLRVLDFLLRTHALNKSFPAPLPEGMERDGETAARWCFAAYGNMAHCATHQQIEFQLAQVPLRTHSLLHIAVAHADREKITALLATGISADLLAGDGLAPLHWALAKNDLAIMGILIEGGSSVDVQSAEGATPLMNAVQGSNIGALAFLLARGAKVDTPDQRGFTALHRAAEMGHLDIAKALIEAGASPLIEAQGHTPLTLAEKRGLTEMIRVLNATT